METEYLLENQYDAVYNQLYLAYRPKSDEELTALWVYHQTHHKQRGDRHWIGFLVCEDLLRQRGNTILDRTYPKN